MVQGPCADGSVYDSTPGLLSCCVWGQFSYLPFCSVSLSLKCEVIITDGGALLVQEGLQ